MPHTFLEAQLENTKTLSLAQEAREHLFKQAGSGKYMKVPWEGEAT